MEGARRERTVDVFVDSRRLIYGGDLLFEDCLGMVYYSIGSANSSMTRKICEVCNPGQSLFHFPNSEKNQFESEKF